MIRLFAVLLLSLQSATPPTVSAAPVLPEDSKPSYRAHSAPACPDWRAARDGKARDSALSSAISRLWVQGYVTGFNVVGPDQSGNLLGTASHEEVYTAIDRYCARNPTRTVVDAMRPIAEAIIRRRGTPATAATTSEAKRRATVDATQTCRDWAQGRDNAIIRLAHVAVLLGYVTAYNQWGPDPIGDAIGADDRSVTERVTDKWCAEHPAGLLIGAVTPLINYVAAERLAGRLPPGGKRVKDKQ